MRLVSPISRSDSDRLPIWSEIHEYLKSSGLNHSLHFVVPQAIASEAHDAKARLQGLFESIHVHEIDTEPYGGWPYAPNMHFWHCANFMFRDNPNLPWQLVELDCLPIKPNAYDLIASRYASCGAPFFGNVDKTPWRETEQFLRNGEGQPTQVKNPNYGKITKSIYGDRDVMMSGCAVYPGNLIARPSCAGLMADFVKGAQSIDVPWDMHLRAAMQADGLADTKLIGQYWNTGNYTVNENGYIECQSLEGHEFFQANPQFQPRDCGGIVNPESVMIHGCKDDSLVKLILGGKIPEAPVLRQVQAAQPLPQPPSMANPQKDERLDRLEDMMKQMVGVVSNLVKKQETPTTGGDAGKAATSSLLEQILAALPVVGKKQMLSALSKNLSTDKSLLKSTIEASGKFSIRGPAEWVERIAA